MNLPDFLKIAFISTYPPRKCGIGTFTYDLVSSLKKLYQLDYDTQDHLQVVALNNTVEGYDFSSDVNFVIREQYKNDYQEAAEFLNLSSVEIVNLQHEFGIFGGNDGNHILDLLKLLEKPVITTLHTVLENPTPGQRETLLSIINYSTVIVVLANKAIEILKSQYNVAEKKLVMIPHGAPDVAFMDTSYYKDQFQAENRRIILTFGLLGPGKGIEYVIKALPQVVKRFPDILYIVLGATHPNVKREQGEKYRFYLESLVNDLDLRNHVIFYNQFVSLEKLIEFLVAADIYITPYQSKEQISSGTLSYAVSTGKAIISTPYSYAEEILDCDRGILVPFQASKKIADNISNLLSDEILRNRIRKNAYQYGRGMIWDEVARQYDQIFERAISVHGRKKTDKKRSRTLKKEFSLPEFRMNYLKILTDDTGIFQHAIYRTPSRFDGYTTDDNVRALKVAVMYYSLFPKEEVLRLIHIYLSFVTHAFDIKTKRLHNFMSYSRQWLDEIGSDDCHGRALWCLGYTVWKAPTSAVLSIANHLFNELQSISLDLKSPRAWAYSIIGCIHYLQRFGGNTETQNLIAELGQRLSSLYARVADKNWQWFENIVAYANARLSQGLIAAGYYLGNKIMLSQGIESLEWLIKIQTEPKSKVLSLVGNSEWYKKDGRKPKFDQQPIEAYCIMDACYEAFLATGDRKWQNEIEKAFFWFLGKNDKNEFLYDFESGGCFDGLQRGGVNLNQGAESTLSWMAALHLMHQISPAYQDLLNAVQFVGDR